MKVKVMVKAAPKAKASNPHIRMRKLKAVPPSAFPPGPVAFPPANAGPPGPDAAMGAPPSGAAPGMLGG